MSTKHKEQGAPCQPRKTSKTAAAPHLPLLLTTNPGSPAEKEPLSIHCRARFVIMFASIYSLRIASNNTR